MPLKKKIKVNVLGENEKLYNENENSFCTFMNVLLCAWVSTWWFVNGQNRFIDIHVFRYTYIIYRKGKTARNIILHYIQYMHKNFKRRVLLLLQCMHSNSNRLPLRIFILCYYNIIYCYIAKDRKYADSTTSHLRQ